MSADDFNGIGHVHSRTEDGRGYGLNSALYTHMAQAAMSASRETGIEPANIWPVPDGPGCELLLEKQRAFRLSASGTPGAERALFRVHGQPGTLLGAGVGCRR